MAGQPAQEGGGTALLLSRLRKQREEPLPIGDGRVVLMLRRPAHVEGIRSLKNAEIDFDYCSKFIVGWSGVIERDILGDQGGDEPVPFDPLLVPEWIGDKPDLLDAIREKCMAMVKAFVERQEALAKN